MTSATPVKITAIAAIPVQTAAAPTAAAPATAPGAAPVADSGAGKSKPSVLASDTIATANELVYDDA